MDNQAIKVGELHKIYDDPITRQKLEGHAKVRKILHKHARHLEAYDLEGLTLWACEVVFKGDAESYTRMVAVEN